MNLDFTISRYPLTGSPFLGTIRAAIYEATNPTAEVDHQDFVAPHTTSRAISFSDVDAVTYIVKIIALPSSELLSWVQHPRQTSVEVKFPIFFRIGDGLPNTPTAGTNTYSNSELVGWEYWVERRGAGTLVDDQTKSYKEITKDTVAGGFTLALSGDIFSDTETFVVHFLPKITTTSIEGVISGKWFSGAKVVDADKTYDGTDFRKLLLLRPAAGTITYTLPVGNTFPVGYVMAFQSYGITANYIIQRNSTDNIEVGGADVTSIALTKNQFLILVWDDITTKWQVVAQAGAGGAAITLSDDPDLNDGSLAASTIATAILAARIKIIYVGSLAIGDVPPNGPFIDPIYTITHNQNISGDYYVIGSIRSKTSGTNQYRDNSVTWAYFAVAANNFKIIMQELDGDTQNIDFTYMLVKP